MKTNDKTLAEPITVEAVASIRRNGDGDRYIDWLTEGGIADLEVGDVLMVSDRAITDEDGSGEVYTAPPAQSAGEPMEMRICELRHISLKPNRPYIFTIDANCANCRADAAYAMGHTDTKPAQAVDLAEFKALYRAYVHLLESGRDRIIDLGGTCDPVDVMEANDVDLQAARRVMDSQAVGNG